MVGTSFKLNNVEYVVVEKSGYDKLVGSIETESSCTYRGVDAAEYLSGQRDPHVLVDCKGQPMLNRKERKNAN